MKNFLIKLALTLWIVWWLTLVSSCTSQYNMTAKQGLKKDQKYYNYESAMKRAKKNK